MALSTDHSLGTIGGTAIAIVGIIDPNDIFKTIILAALGAVVSFLVSKLMKYVFKKRKHK